VSESATRLDVLDRLEKAIGRLADGTAPLEELAVAYEDGLKILAAAEERLARLAAAVGEKPA